MPYLKPRSKAPTPATITPVRKRCNPGRYRADSLRCDICQPGRAASQPTVPEGSVSDARCADCSNGRFQPAGGQIQCFACKSCPQNQHRHNCGGRSMGECHVCPKGRYAIGAAGGADPAIVALAGQKWLDQNCATCQPCPPALFRVGCGANVAGECVPCPTGKYKEV